VLPLLLVIAAVAVAGLAYASLIERNWFALRVHRVPCLPAGSRPVRLLHISDLHFRRGQRRKRAFLARCARTEPDLVVCTGDFLGGPDVDATIDAVTQIHPREAALYVLGSNDYYASRPTNPFKYFLGPSNRKKPKGKRNPWRDLVAGLGERGWRLLNNEATAFGLAGVGKVDVVGLDDPHLFRDDLSVARARRADDGFRLAIVHSPDAAPALAQLEYDLIVCGHTHGGQVRVPGIGALVTNSTLPRGMARGLHRLDAAWLHVNAGMGTSPFAPYRFACRPEACLLELVPRGV